MLARCCLQEPWAGAHPPGPLAVVGVSALLRPCSPQPETLPVPPAGQILLLWARCGSPFPVTPRQQPVQSCQTNLQWTPWCQRAPPFTCRLASGAVRRGERGALLPLQGAAAGVGGSPHGRQGQAVAGGHAQTPCRATGAQPSGHALQPPWASRLEGSDTLPPLLEPLCWIRGWGHLRGVH